MSAERTGEVRRTSVATIRTVPAGGAHYADDRDDARLNIPAAYNLTHDRVRWGPIWAGLVTALTTMLLLGILGVAVGLTAADAADTGATGPGGTTGPMAGIWGATSALVAFFLGGWVAGRMGAVFDRRWGAWNGALVFLLAVPLTLWLAASGLGMLLGSLGNFAGALNIDPSQIAGGAQSVAGQTTRTVGPADVARAAEAARNGAWGALIGLLLGVGAATFGGALGTRTSIAVDRAEPQISRD